MVTENTDIHSSRNKGRRDADTLHTYASAWIDEWKEGEARDDAELRHRWKTRGRRGLVQISVGERRKYMHTIN